MKAILLDWDGVLVDSTEMYYHSYNALCEKFARPCPVHSVEEFRSWYNPVWENNYFEMGFTAEDLPMIAEFTANFISYDPIQFFPKIDEMLHDLSQEHPIAIVSTSNAEVIRAKLASVGLDKYITHITGADGISDKVEKIKRTLQLLNCQQGVMVGDTPLDISCGQANHLATVGTTYGWVSSERIHKANPTVVIDNSCNLKSAIINALNSQN